MQLGMIGLGRMGGNMVRRLMRAGHACVAYDHSPQSIEALGKEGATGASSAGVGRREVSSTFPLGSTIPPSTFVPPTSTPIVNDTASPNFLDGTPMATRVTLTNGQCLGFAVSQRRTGHLMRDG